MDDDLRYSRNVALFGAAGQRRIATSRVAIVGVGGLGSIVAQQLSHLGVGRLVLIDPDAVTLSSLNRLVGSEPADAVGGTDKATVVRRACLRIRPDASITAIASALDQQAARDAIMTCTSVISCVDTDTARLDLAALCCRNRLPFFDLASDTGEDARGHWYGGRVLFSGLGERCPVCMDVISQEALIRESMSAEQLDVDGRIYGVRRDSLDISGPSVISLNGVVASLAVTEWMVWTTGLRAPNALVEYRGNVGAVFVNNDAPRGDCYYCAQWISRAGS